MGLFDWFRSTKSPLQVTDEVAATQHNARIRRYAESAQIKFIHYYASDEFIYDNTLNNLSLDEFSKEIERLKKISEQLLTVNPEKLDKEIKDGLQVLWWIFNTVKDKQSKHIFDGVICGALRLESKVNQHMLSRVLILISSKILKENTTTRNHILENLATHIALQEHISHQFELQNSL